MSRVFILSRYFVANDHIYFLRAKLRGKGRPKKKRTAAGMRISLSDLYIESSRC